MIHNSLKTTFAVGLAALLVTGCDGAAGEGDKETLSNPAKTHTPPSPPVADQSDAAAKKPAADIDWGDDEGDWTNDGECDDPRFEGPGMTSTTLLDEDILKDATDCREAYEAGKLTVK